MYGLKRTTIIEILRVKDKIMQAVDDGYGTNRKNFKNAESPVLDQRLLEWFRGIRSQKTPVIEHESTQCQEPMEVNLLEHDESEEDPQSFME
uniref:Uncharacterized protein n=1 Tax=Acrobeloides nanus TaxID=290746 RepID=A0A914DY62_9BILA